MKRILSLILVALLSLSLFACGKGADESAKDKVEVGIKDDKTIKIGLLKIDDSVPFFIAEEEGLFEKYGVKVELVPFASSSDQSIAFEAGELDMAMNDMIVQGLLKKGGTDTKIVQTAFGANKTEGRFVLVANKNSGINAPQDLDGKTVAISNNTMMDYLLEQFEDIYALDSAKINTVNMPNLMLRVESLLEGKDIDAALLPDPLASFAISKGAVAVIDDTLLDENLSQSVVLASDEVIANYGENVQAVLDAYSEAKELINNDSEKYKESCLTLANVPEDLKATYATPKYTAWALPSAEEVERVQKWLRSRELITEIYSYEELVDASFNK